MKIHKNHKKPASQPASLESRKTYISKSFKIHENHGIQKSSHRVQRGRRQRRKPVNLIESEPESTCDFESDPGGPRDCSTPLGWGGVGCGGVGGGWRGWVWVPWWLPIWSWWLPKPWSHKTKFDNISSRYLHMVPGLPLQTQNPTSLNQDLHQITFSYQAEFAIVRQSAHHLHMQNCIF